VKGLWHSCCWQPWRAPAMRQKSGVRMVEGRMRDRVPLFPGNGHHQHHRDKRFGKGGERSSTAQLRTFVWSRGRSESSLCRKDQIFVATADTSAETYHRSPRRRHQQSRTIFEAMSYSRRTIYICGAWIAMCSTDGRCRCALSSSGPHS
jgi:hypothetical protein